MFLFHKSSKKTHVLYVVFVGMRLSLSLCWNVFSISVRICIYVLRSPSSYLFSLYQYMSICLYTYICVALSVCASSHLFTCRCNRHFVWFLLRKECTPVRREDDLNASFIFLNHCLLLRVVDTSRLLRSKSISAVILRICVPIRSRNVSLRKAFLCEGSYVDG